MGDGRRTQIALIDERQLDITVQPRLSVDELLNIVASHCHLKAPDKMYFGLAFLDDKQQTHWLQNDRRVLDHEYPRKFTMPGATLVLHHIIRLFVDSITHLAHPSTVELFFMYASSQVHRGVIVVDSDSLFLLAAYFVQIYYGDYSDNQSALNSFKHLPLFPARTLKEYTSIHACEEKVLVIYKDLKGVSRGKAIVRYMEIIERVPTYGMHFFEVKDKAGNSFDLGISRLGVFQYVTGDRIKPIKIFQWKQLENLYYRDRKFSIEIHESKRVMLTVPSINLFDDMANDPSSEMDELASAVLDPSSQVSVSRRAFMPSQVRIQIYFCETPHLCKSIWALTIAQHQFYLDRKTLSKNGNSPILIASENLAEKLDSVVNVIQRSAGGRKGSSSHSVFATNRLNSIDSASGQQNAYDSGFSFSSSSSPSLHTIERSEDDRKRDFDRSGILKTRKLNLQKLLAEKMAQLRQVCLKEGGIIGQLPPEIRHTLAPGEPEPKVQRRVGTTFCIPLDLVAKHTKVDRIVKLETESEVQRKIVTAALKLANDTSSNKVIRKKRRRDYECALLKLRELDQQLNQLRLSSSKPDISDRKISCQDFQPMNDCSEKITSPLRPIKSAPTTPRGSVNDLSQMGPSKIDHSVRKSKYERQSIIRNLEEPAGAESHPAVSTPLDQTLISLSDLACFEHYDHFGSSSSPLNPTSYSRNNLGKNQYSPTTSISDAGSNTETRRTPALIGRCWSASNAPAVAPILLEHHRLGAYNVPRRRTSWDYEAATARHASLLLVSSCESLDGGAASQYHRRREHCRPIAEVAALSNATVNSAQSLNVNENKASDPTGLTPNYSNSTLDRHRIMKPPPPSYSKAIAASPRFARRPPLSGVTSHCYTGSLDRRRAAKHQMEERPSADLNQAAPHRQLKTRLDPDLSALLVASGGDLISYDDQSPPRYVTKNDSLNRRVRNGANQINSDHFKRPLPPTSSSVLIFPNKTSMVIPTSATSPALHRVVYNNNNLQRLECMKPTKLVLSPASPTASHSSGGSSSHANAGATKCEMSSGNSGSPSRRGFIETSKPYLVSDAVLFRQTQPQPQRSPPVRLPPLLSSPGAACAKKDQNSTKNSSVV